MKSYLLIFFQRSPYIQGQFEKKFETVNCPAAPNFRSGDLFSTCRPQNKAEKVANCCSAFLKRCPQIQIWNGCSGRRRFRFVWIWQSKFKWERRWGFWSRSWRVNLRNKTLKICCAAYTSLSFLSPTLSRKIQLQKNF